MQPHLLTPEPSLSAILPNSDEDWHNGRISSFRHTLGTPSADVGGFAGNARAAYLLSCAYGENTDTGKESATNDDGEARFQLNRTIWAQLEVIKALSEASSPIECTSSAICHSALIVFSRSIDFTGNPLQPHERIVASLEIPAGTAVRVARCFLRESRDLEFGSVSPYMLPWLYLSAKFLLAQGSGPEFEIVKMAVRRLRSYWRAAGLW